MNTVTGYTFSFFRPRLGFLLKDVAGSLSMTPQAISSWEHSGDKDLPAKAAEWVNTQRTAFRQCLLFFLMLTGREMAGEDIPEDFRDFAGQIRFTRAIPCPEKIRDFLFFYPPLALISEAHSSLFVTAASISVAFTGLNLAMLSIDGYKMWIIREELPDSPENRLEFLRKVSAREIGMPAPKAPEPAKQGDLLALLKGQAYARA